MARDLTTGMQIGVEADLVRPFFLVSAAFATGTLYVWTGYGNIQWNGQTWVGVGTLGKIDSLPETSTLQAQGIALSLSSIPSDLLGEVMDEIQHGLPAQVYLGLMGPPGAIIASPYLAFSGLIDSCKLNDDGQTAIATLTVESRIFDFQRSRERRYTNEDQQLSYAGDLGFEYVPLVQNWVGYLAAVVGWGPSSAEIL